MTETQLWLPTKAAIAVGVLFTELTASVLAPFWTRSLQSSSFPEKGLKLFHDSLFLNSDFICVRVIIPARAAK